MSPRAEVNEALNTTHARWYPGLAVSLASVCWDELASFGIDRTNYGTIRVLECNPSLPQHGMTITRAELGRPLLIEQYMGPLAKRYDAIGLQAPTSFNLRDFERQFSSAVTLLDSVPSVAAAVRALLWALVPVAVEGAEYDTGYSDPAVPFTIFIGSHRIEDQVPAIRLAEGILHETMHLQLSLIEDVVPLIAGNLELRVSPWQRRPRPMQGILHGLYVFRVIQDWLAALEHAGALAAEDRQHAAKRILEIDAECSRLGDITASSDLTAHGRALARSLMIGRS